MTGEVSTVFEATLPLRLRTSNGEPIGTVVATIDTGFTEFLLLPPEIVEPLDLGVQEEAVIGLGDGTTTLMNVVSLDVEWSGRWTTVPVHVADSDALIGVSLLKGQRLCVDFAPGGEVRVEPL